MQTQVFPHKDVPIYQTCMMCTVSRPKRCNIYTIQFTKLKQLINSIYVTSKNKSLVWQDIIKMVPR